MNASTHIFDNFPTVTKVSEKTPIANTNHYCDICGHVIPRGTAHTKVVYRLHGALNPRLAIRQVRYHFTCPSA